MLIVAAALLLELTARVNHDAAWNLYVARLLTHGMRLYRDIWEIQPPLWYVVLRPVVRAPDPFLAFRLAIFLFSLLAAGLVGRLLPGRPPWAIPIVLAATLLLAAADFGEQEQALAIATAPLVALASRRLAGMATDVRLAVLVGIVSGTGFALKPQYAGIWLGIAAVVWLRTRRVWPEHVALITLGAAYLAAVAWFVPEYWAEVRTIGGLYLNWLHEPLWAIWITSPVASLGLVVCVGWALTRRRAVDSGLGDLLAVATIGALAGLFIQGKGFPYHSLPAAAAEFGLAGVLCRSPQPARWVGIAAILSLLTVAAHADFERSVDDRAAASLASATRAAAPAGGSLLVLTHRVRDGWPLVQETGLRWTSRFPSSWWMAALSVQGGAHPVAERVVRAAAIADWTRDPADVIITLRTAEALDELRLTMHYVRLREVGPFLIWRRRA